MTRTFLIIFIQLLLVVFCQAQSKVSVFDALNTIAQKQDLELSFSPDLVNLSDSILLNFNASTETCIAKIENQANVEITKTEKYLIVTPAIAFQTIVLKGKVIDTKTREALPHAHLLIGKRGLGTITNTLGIFAFTVSNKMAFEKITFSFLGYENQSIEIPGCSTDSLVIEMTPKPYTLDDVYVLPNGNEAIGIVKRAVKNIKRNYHRKTVQMEAFYRNTSFNNDGKASQLIEAALLIEDKGIAKSPTSAKIDLQEIRKSLNYLVPKTRKHLIWEKVFGHRNFIHRCYNKNMVRYYQQDWWFQPLTNNDDFLYEFESFVWLDSVKVYKIKYIWNAMLPDGKRVTEHNNHGKTGGYFFISTKDFGILKIKQQSWPREGSPWNQLDHDNRGIKKSEISYQKINGRYYLKYITGFAQPNGKPIEFEDEKAQWNDLKIKSRQWAEEILLITQVNSDRKKFEKIKYREKLKKSENSYEKCYPYNANFWNNYNILKKNPVEEKFISDMEWEKSIDIQFQENSSNHDND